MYTNINGFTSKRPSNIDVWREYGFFTANETTLAPRQGGGALVWHALHDGKRPRAARRKLFIQTGAVRDDCVSCGQDRVVHEKIVASLSRTQSIRALTF